ncbi:hypothetical protein VPZ60_004269 [Salmonella enterica]|nr:hypothetical protein [Salmonella enterica]
MPALITLTDDQQGQLKELLNNLNRGLAKVHFGEMFVSWLNGEKIELTTFEQYRLKKLLNNLNIAARKLPLGDLILSLFDDATRPSVLHIISDRQIEDTRRLFDGLNLDIQEFGLGDMMVEVLSGPTTRVAAINPTIDMIDGATVDVKTLFRVVGGTATYKATGKGSLTGDTLTVSGLGTATVTATLAGADGSPATVKVTVKAPPIVVTPKTAPADFKVTDTDLAASALFTTTPANSALTLDIPTAVPAIATIVGGKLHAVGAGDVTVRATATDGVTATLKVNVKPAPPTITAIHLESKIAEWSDAVPVLHESAEFFTVTGSTLKDYNLTSDTEAIIKINYDNTLGWSVVKGNSATPPTANQVVKITATHKTIPTITAVANYTFKA